MSYNKRVSKSVDPSLQDMRTLCWEHYLSILALLFLGLGSWKDNYSLLELKDQESTSPTSIEGRTTPGRVTTSLSHN